MKRLYEPSAYETPKNCFWTQALRPVAWPRGVGRVSAEVAIIGGGYTGLSTALRLADRSVDVALFEARTPGWGASGRNGGFCCLGGGRLGRSRTINALGPDAWSDWCDAQKMAVQWVDRVIVEHALEVERHSNGETVLAHSARAMADLRADAQNITQDFAVTPTLHEASDLRGQGLSGPFHGAMTLPIGFALNPARYHAGLAGAAQAAGVQLYQQAPVTRITAHATGYRLDGPDLQCDAQKVVLATNGYSSEDIPDWLRGRTLPVMSSIIITRPLTHSEMQAQGWTSDQMAYDSRTLLHYFRKLPDNRFLFGMRGGLRATPGAEAAIARKIRKDFYTMFPAWRDVEITHAWSGLACLMSNLSPFCAEVPGHSGLFAGLGYHGNGVAMASYTGRLLGDLVLGETPDMPYPTVMRTVPKRFPLGRYRRALLTPVYAAATLLDR